MAVHKEFGLIPIHVKGIKGEPFLVKAWQKSKVWNGSFFLDGTVCHQRKWAVPTQAKIKIPPRGKYEPIDKPQYDEVIVDIQRACDWTLEKMEAGMHEFCYEMEETRKCVDVIVRPPTGKDSIVFRQIFQYTKREDRLYYHIMDILPNERKIGPYILKHYPTSTYAGWALWQMAHSYVTSWNWYDIKADKAFRLPPFGTIAKTSEKNIWNTLRKLVRYYPDFALRDEALYLYAIGSLRVKVVREARWALSKLAREYPDSPWRGKARAIEAFLQTLSHKTQ